MAISNDLYGEMIRILIVEDEGIIAKDIQKCLEDLGHQVIGIASSGPEAIEIVSLIAVDLVLMDIRLHGQMDGIATAERIRNQFDTPVVYLTAHADEATLRKAADTEPFGYLLKPFTESSIESVIRIALKRSKLERELKKERAWLRTILRTAADAIIATDYEGNVQFLNAAAEALTGWTAAEAHTRSLTDAMDLLVDCRNGESLGLPDVMRQREVRVATTVITDAISRKHPVSACVAPITDSEHRISGVVWTFRLLAAVPLTQTLTQPDQLN